MDHLCACMNGNGNNNNNSVRGLQLSTQQWYKRPGHFKGMMVYIYENFSFSFFCHICDSMGNLGIQVFV